MGECLFNDKSLKPLLSSSTNLNPKISDECSDKTVTKLGLAAGSDNDIVSKSTTNGRSIHNDDFDTCIAISVGP